MTMSIARTMKLGISFFFKKFNSSKCKTAAKMAVARIKLLRNKREVVVRQMRRDIALLLQSKQDATARIRVEHVIREQNVLAANEFIELFCELIVARLSIISKQRECPADLKEGIASVIFAAPRCSEITELGAIRDIFEKKYGKDFVSAATDLRPNSGVNRMLIEKLSVRTPTGEVKLKLMKEIAKEYQIDWDTTELEMELLKPPEEPIEGPDTFVSATSLPVKHVPVQSVESNKPNDRSVSNKERGAMQFEDTASAAEAAADSAKRAIAAAQAAAYLASRGSKQLTQASGLGEVPDALNNYRGSATLSGSENSFSPGNVHMSQSSHGSHYHVHIDGSKFHRRNSKAPSANSDIKFDESDCDDDNSIMEGPSGGKGFRRQSYNAPSAHSDVKFDGSKMEGPSGEKGFRRQSYNAPSAHSDVKFDDPSAHSDVKFDESDCDDDNSKMGGPPGGKGFRRQSYNAPSAHSDVQWDESDCDEKIEVEAPPGRTSLPPERPPPPVPTSLGKQGSIHRVHPKLPDYDDLAAHFEALKYRKL